MNVLGSLHLLDELLEAAQLVNAFGNSQHLMSSPSDDIKVMFACLSAFTVLIVLRTTCYRVLWVLGLLVLVRWRLGLNHVADFHVEDVPFGLLVIGWLLPEHQEWWQNLGLVAAEPRKLCLRSRRAVCPGFP